MIETSKVSKMPVLSPRHARCKKNKKKVEVAKKKKGEKVKWQNGQ